MAPEPQEGVRRKAGSRALSTRAPSANGPELLPKFKWLIACDEQAAGGYQPHRHLDFEAIFVEAGIYSCKLNGEELELKPGEGVLVKPGDCHEDSFSPPLRYTGFNFTFLDLNSGSSSAPGIFMKGLRPAGQKFSFDQHQMNGILSAIKAESRQEDRFSSLAQDFLCLQALRIILKGLPEGSLNEAFGKQEPGGDGALKASMLQLLHDSASGNPSVAEMAQALKMSVSGFSHECARLLGLPPRKAFLKIKMEKAKTLLADKGLPVKKLAAMLGYDDQFAFSRAFKNASGYAPETWRKSHLC